MLPFVGTHRAPMSAPAVWSRIVLALAMVLPALGSLAPTAMAAPTCGATIASSVKLTADLPCPSSNGIVVDGGSGITIDLNGYTVSGNNGDGEFAGIVVANAARVKVVNGTIRGFYDAVSVAASSSLTFDDLLLIATDTDGATVGADGIVLSEASGVTINNVVVLDQHGGGSNGFYVYGNAGKTMISNSSIRGFNVGVRAEGGVVGGALTLSNNLLLGQGFNALNYRGAGALGLSANTVVDAGDIGVFVECSQDTAYGPLTFTGNRALRSQSYGFYLSYCEKGKSSILGNLAAENGAGFYIVDLPNSTIKNNRAVSNHGTGMDLYETDNVTITGNRADLNEGAGIYLNDGASDPQPAAVDDNISRGNSDGFSVAFDAVFPSSGNRAFGNTNGGSADCGDNPDFDCVVHVVGGVTKACEASITTSVVLAGDIDDCSGDEAAALDVPAGTSRVTIDLNGYTLDAGGALSGIRLDSPAKSITIKNGIITGSANQAIELISSPGAAASSVRVENVLFSPQDSGTEDGVVNTAGNGTTVAVVDSVFALSSTEYSQGVLSSAIASTVSVSGSVFSGGRTAIDGSLVKVDGVVALSGAGVRGAEDSVIANSVISPSRPGEKAISIICTVGTSIKVTGNTLTGTQSNQVGLITQDCGGGTVSNNLMAHFQTGVSLTVVDATTFSGNRSFSNLFFGFALGFLKATGVVKANYADANGEDGFNVVGAPGGGVRSFSGNFARGNGGLGFYVGEPLGGSGNIAFGNTDGNCSDVVCSIGPVLP